MMTPDQARAVLIAYRSSSARLGEALHVLLVAGLSPRQVGRLAGITRSKVAKLTTRYGPGRILPGP